MGQHIEQWTQDQAIAFESARECISDLMAIYSATLDQERGKAQPDAAVIEELLRTRAGLAAERSGLSVTDDADVAAVRQRYGAIVSEYRSRYRAAA